MRVPQRERQRGLRFNITPLIDIVFLLIIFFLAASHFVRSESAEPVELPLATQGKEEQQEAAPRVIVTVTEDRALSVAGRPAELAQIGQMLAAARLDHPEQQPELRIRADRSAPYEAVEPLLLAAARNGVTKIRVAVLPD